MPAFRLRTRHRIPTPEARKRLAHTFRLRSTDVGIRRRMATFGGPPSGARRRTAAFGVRLRNSDRATGHGYPIAQLRRRMDGRTSAKASSLTPSRGPAPSELRFRLRGRSAATPSAFRRWRIGRPRKDGTPHDSTQSAFGYADRMRAVAYSRQREIGGLPIQSTADIHVGSADMFARSEDMLIARCRACEDWVIAVHRTISALSRS